METSIFFRNCQVDMFIKNVYRPKVNSCHWNRETLFPPVMFPSFLLVSVNRSLLLKPAYFFLLFKFRSPNCRSDSNSNLTMRRTCQRYRQEAAEPLLHAALKGGRSSLIFFGQTGTGKTYTARGVLEAETGWKMVGTPWKKHHRMAPVCWVPLFTEITGWSWCYINFSLFLKKYIDETTFHVGFLDLHFSLAYHDALGRWWSKRFLTALRE